ncbi:MAG TPA: alpha/beta fold hydrolase [Ktedonobacteraceae bacterium]|nr:alpha/beta fold hydrolase [Ktedonobacteraceae bacterium]
MSSNEVVQRESGLAPPEESRPSRKRTPYIVLLLAIVLIIGGGILANVTQTVGGQVAVREVQFAGTNGVIMDGLLYVPKTATSKTPACGVVAIHGYINSRDTMDGFAIEMARRGCVVLAVDQTGHGFSDPPAFANGYGGPDALAYLNSLDIVRKNDIGLIGHSMGGWASVAAAFAHPDAYRSLVLVSSSTSTPPLEPVPGTATFPKNVQVVEARYSEFSALMWAEPIGSQFPASTRMQALFGISGGISQAIQVGHVYGSIADGTARQLDLVSTTHPGLTFSNEAIGDAVSWMQQTLVGVDPLSASDQIWIWDEIGTLLALIGVILLIFPTGTLLLRTPFFASLAQDLPVAKPLQGVGWLIGVVILIATSVLTFFLFQVVGNALLPASALFPQTITTGVMTWAIGGGLIGLILFLVWHFTTNRRQGARLANYGITGANNTFEWGKLGKAVLFAVCVLVAPYVALGFLDWAFHTDARIWVFNAKVITPYHVPIILSYLIPFALYFLMLGVILHGELRSKHLSVGGEIVKNVVILVIGFVILLLYEYIPLLAGGVLGTPDQPLLTIVAFQFVPFYIIIAAISTYFFYKTGRIYAGAFINALFIVALMVTSTATQFPVLGR